LKAKIKWINAAKVVAILGVMIDHTNGVLYTNINIAWGSYFSVSLFILLSGMTSYLSDSTQWHGGKYIFIKSAKKILLPYSICVLLYQVVATHYFDFTTYLKYFINFNISGPHYFVLLYLQLMLVRPILSKCLAFCSGKREILWEFFIAIVVLGISLFTVNYTNILDVYGGGGKLLGGTYLFLYYLGMLLMKHEIFDSVNPKRCFFTSVISFALCFFWWRYMCQNQLGIDAMLPFGGGFNPPGLSISIFACIVLFGCYGIFIFISSFEHTKFIVEIFSQIGRHTLYIFLYHRMFLDYLLIPYVQLNIGIVKTIIYFGVMIGGSLVLDLMINKLIECLAYVMKQPIPSKLTNDKQVIQKNIALLLALPIIAIVLGVLIINNSIKKMQVVQSTSIEYVAVENVLAADAVDVLDTDLQLGVADVGAMLSAEPITLTSDTLYEISFDMECTEQLPELLYFDFYGTDYDSHAQDFEFEFESGRAHYTQICNSGQVPGDAVIRMIYITDQPYVIENFKLSIMAPSS